MKLDPQFIPYMKITSKWIKDLCVTPKTLNCLKENKKIHGIRLGIDSLGITAKLQMAKEKLDR